MRPERDGRLDFSFSGVKTAVLRHVRARQAALGVERLPDAEIADLCASFQRIVRPDAGGTDLRGGALATARASVGVAGGVSANSRLRAELEARGRARGLPGVRAAARPRHRQRRHDRGRRRAAASRRGALPTLGLNAVPSLALG